MGPNQARWLATLESDEYAQTKYALHKDDGFCCLGVACELFKTPEVEVGYNEYEEAITYEDNWEEAPAYVRQALALNDGLGTPADGAKDMRLSDLNDGGKTFAEIAAIIRANPARYFTKEV